MSDDKRAAAAYLVDVITEFGDVRLLWRKAGRHATETIGFVGAGVDLARPVPGILPEITGAAMPRVHAGAQPLVDVPAQPDDVLIDVTGINARHEQLARR